MALDGSCQESTTGLGLRGCGFRLFSFRQSCAGPVRVGGRILIARSYMCIHICKYMCIYIYIETVIYAYIHVYIHIYIYIERERESYVCIHAHMRTHTVDMTPSNFEPASGSRTVRCLVSNQFRPHFDLHSARHRSRPSIEA